MWIFEILFEVFLQFIVYFTFNHLGTSVAWLFRKDRSKSYLELYKNEENILLGFFMFVLILGIIGFIIIV